MRISELSFLALRIFSIYLIYIGISQIFGIYVSYESWKMVEDTMNQHNKPNFLIYALPTIITIFIGLVLWIFAQKLSHFFVLDNQKVDQKDVEYKVTYNMIISFIGIVIVIIAIVNLVKTVPTLQQYNYNFSPMKNTYLYEFIGESVRLFLGICLFIAANARKIIKFK